MQGAFEPVLVIVCGLGIACAVFALISASKTPMGHGKNRTVMRES